MNIEHLSLKTQARILKMEIELEKKKESLSKNRHRMDQSRIYMEMGAMSHLAKSIVHLREQKVY